MNAAGARGARAAFAFPFDKLSEDNYDAWCTRAEQYLVTLGLWPVVVRGVAAPAAAAAPDADEDEEEDDAAPADDAPLPRTDENVALDMAAKAAIGAATSDAFLQAYRDATSAKALWAALRDTYSGQTRARQQLLRRQFNALRLDKGESLEGLASRARLLRNQLQAAGRQVPEDELVSAFLAALPEDTYGTMVRVLCSTTVEMDLNAVVNALLPDQERARAAGRAGHDAGGAAAFFAAGGGGQGRGGYGC